MNNKVIESIKLILLCILCLFGVISGIWAINCAFLNGNVFYAIAGFISIAFQLYLTKKVGTNISSKPLETTKPNGSSHLGVHIESNENPINYEVEDKIKE